jgi:hypothetical protein
MLRRFAMAMMLAIPVGVSAQNVIDVNQTSNTTQFRTIFNSSNEGPNGYASLQTFSTTKSNVSGAGFYLLNSQENSIPSNGPFYVDIALYAADPGMLSNPKPVALASARTSVTIPVGTAAWVDGFWTPLGVTPGSTYWLAVWGESAGQRWWVTEAATDPAPYSGGSAAESYVSSFGTGGTTASPNYDLTFRTYTFRSETPSSTVPEPSTVALLAAGLCGVAVVRRRKAKAQ